MATMLTAAIGLLGVAVGALLSQLLAAARERRSRRLDALADAAAACARVLGAQERIYDLFAGGDAPSLATAPTEAALTERSEALADWRAAEARLLMLIPEDRELLAAVEAFGKKRALATKWIRVYQEQGELEFPRFAGQGWAFGV
jgi:hypothetical protein